ncbi:MAG: response regulator [Labilithrix sp.]|nr:response regulator [Labilithrix sp.]
MPRLLLVDDEILILEELAAFLTRIGHDVVVADTLALAEAALAREPFGAMIVDVRMGTSTAVDWLASSGWALRLPTLLLSGIADLDEVLRGIVVGALDFVHKTDPPEALALAVESALERRDESSTPALDLDLTSLEMAGELAPNEVRPALLGGKLRYVVEISQGAERHILLEELTDAVPLSSEPSRALDLMARGHSAKQIAFELGVKPTKLSGIVEGARRTLGFRDSRQMRRLMAVLARS